MKPLYRSQIDFYELVIYVVLFSTIISYPIWSSAEDVITKLFAIFSTLVFCYIISNVFANIYYFYEDKEEIVYPSRFKRRKREVSYFDISHIRYTNIGGGYAKPSICFVYKGKPLKWINWSLDSFTHRRVGVRRDILVFLHNKGLPIIINSRFKEDFEILELTKANGSWMDYDVVDGRVIKF